MVENLIKGLCKSNTYFECTDQILQIKMYSSSPFPFIETVLGSSTDKEEVVLEREQEFP